MIFLYLIVPEKFTSFILLDDFWFSNLVKIQFGAQFLWTTFPTQPCPVFLVCNIYCTFCIIIIIIIIIIKLAEFQLSFIRHLWYRFQDQSDLWLFCLRSKH